MGPVQAPIPLGAEPLAEMLAEMLIETGQLGAEPLAEMLQVG